MAFSVELLLANHDILERSARLGVQVSHGPEPGDLTLLCECFDEIDTVNAGRRMYFDVDHATGKIGGCTIYDYEDVLFSDVPLLHQYLQNTEAAPEEQRPVWNLRLLYALLATASPFFATRVVEAYAPQPATVVDSRIGATTAPAGLSSGGEWLKSGIKHLADLISTASGDIRGRAAVGSRELAALAADLRNASVPLRRAPAWAGSLSGSAGAGEASGAVEALNLKGKDRKLTLRLADNGESLLFEGLRVDEDRPISSFRVEIRHGEDTLLVAESQDGLVALPMVDLMTAIEAGADTLVIETNQAREPA